MGYARALAPGQSCRVHVMDVETGDSRVVFVGRQALLEAPNWTAGGHLVLNGDGLLWRLPEDGSAPAEVVALEGVPEINNDHVLAADGRSIHLSANDGHLYTAPLAGGRAERVTSARHAHFLHGASPDGSTLAYVALNIDAPDPWAGAHLRTVAVDGSGDRALTVGGGPDDGPEYSPDGAWVYFNTERFSREPGHAQIARLRPDGSGLEQLTFDERVNWFPHLAPQGDRAVYLSYPPGTTGHPADRPVQLRVVEAGDWRAARIVAELHGGQGTINVNSWSPDGTRFAYVDYPVAAASP